MAEESAWPVDDQIMQDTFDRLKIKNVSWRSVREYVEDYPNQYKDDVLREQITLEIIQAFDDVFYWGDYNITFQSAKAKLIDWIRKHKEFYNDDLRIIYDRMVEIIEQVNKEIKDRLRPNAKWTKIPYINWLPGYGGMIRGNRHFCERQFHKKQLANRYFLAKNPDIESEGSDHDQNDNNENGNPTQYIQPNHQLGPVEDDD